MISTEKVMKSLPFNNKRPFIKSQLFKDKVGAQPNNINNHFMIYGHSENQTDSMHDLSLMGALGIKYSQINMDSNTHNQFNYSGADLLYNLLQDGTIEAKTQQQDMIDRGQVTVRSIAESKLIGEGDTSDKKVINV